MDDDGKPRCGWPGDDQVMLRYHDEEWGVPLHDDRRWFEFLVLDAFQAGLSWQIVLHKRQGFREVFHDFDPAKVAHMTGREIAAACRNPAIVRNKLKIRATVANAGAFLRLQEEQGSFDNFIWSFTDGKPIQNHRRSLSQLPASTRLSDTVCKALKARGFSFVGTTICYAFLQAGGVVNDHMVRCFRHAEVSAQRASQKTAAQR